MLLVVTLVGVLVLPASRATQSLPNLLSLQVPPPKFSVPGGVYTNNLSVELSASSASAIVRYTLDGAEPTAGSSQYTRPIAISATTLLRAKAFDGPSASSAIVSQTYVRLHEDLAEFSSNLPLIILNSFGHIIGHEEKAAVSARIIAPQGARATLLGPADFDGRGDLNIRGHTSLRYRKHSYHFKSRDEDHNPLKASILGLAKDSSWVLYAPYSDKTLMRDVLGYELSNQMGRYAPHTRLVEVFLSEPGGKLSPRDYIGVYVFEEKVDRGKHRVPIEKLGKDDNTEPGVTGGYIFKKDHMDPIGVGEADANGYPHYGGGGGFMSDFSTGPGGFPGDPKGFFRANDSFGGPNGMFQRFGNSYGGSGRQWFTSGHGGSFLYVEPKPTEMTGAQRAWLSSYINQFEKALYGPDFKEPKTGYAAYIDADSFVDHHLLVELCKNIDGFRFSTFYHKDRGGKLTMGPIWDWNLTFGNANGKQGWMPDHWYWPQLDDQQYAWFRRLFEDPDFGQKYVDRWGQLRTNQFEIGKIQARIDELATLLDEAEARNYRRWPILGRAVWPNRYVGHTYNDEVSWMKEWIRKRIEWVDQQFLPAPALSLTSRPVPSGSELTLRCASGRIYYTLDGTDPRAPGGGVSPTAQSYAGPIPLRGNARLVCRTHRDDRWSYPAAAEFTAGPSSGPAK